MDGPAHLGNKTYIDLIPSISYLNHDDLSLQRIIQADRRLCCQSVKRSVPDAIMSFPKNASFQNKLANISMVTIGERWSGMVNISTSINPYAAFCYFG